MQPADRDDNDGTQSRLCLAAVTLNPNHVKWLDGMYSPAIGPEGSVDCELQRGHSGLHAGSCGFSKMGRVQWWAQWNWLTYEIRSFQGCSAERIAGGEEDHNDCWLYLDHPGDHRYGVEDDW